jgi:hypothetical protein
VLGSGCGQEGSPSCFETTDIVTVTVLLESGMALHTIRPPRCKETVRNCDITTGPGYHLQRVTARPRQPQRPVTFGFNRLRHDAPERLLLNYGRRNKAIRACTVRRSCKQSMNRYVPSSI